MSVSDDRRSPVAAVLTALTLGFVGLFVGVLVGIVSTSLVASVVTLPENSPATTAIALVAQGVGLVAVAWIYLEERDLPWSYLRVDRPGLRDVAWALAATIGLFVTLAGTMLVIEQLGLSPTEHSVAQAAEQNPALLLPLIPLSVLVTGPAEELLFRGVIQTRLRESFGAVVAVILAATVFSLVHIPAYGGGGLGLDLATTLGVLFLLGMFLGAVYERTENLVVPAIAHGVYNAVVFGANYVEAIGHLGV